MLLSNLEAGWLNLTNKFVIISPNSKKQLLVVQIIGYKCKRASDWSSAAPLFCLYRVLGTSKEALICAGQSGTAHPAKAGAEPCKSCAVPWNWRLPSCSGVWDATYTTPSTQGYRHGKGTGFASLQCKTQKSVSKQGLGSSLPFSLMADLTTEWQK